MTAFEQIKKSIEMTALVRAVITNNPVYVSLMELEEDEYEQFKGMYSFRPYDAIRTMNYFISATGSYAARERHIASAVNLECLVEADAIEGILGRDAESPVCCGVKKYICSGYTEMADERRSKGREFQEKFRVNKNAIADILIQAKATGIANNGNEENAAQEIARLVSGIMKYNERKVKRVWKKHGDRTVMISRYTDDSFGVCTHFAVLCQLLLQEAGIISKIVIGNVYGAKDGHMWNMAMLLNKRALIDTVNEGAPVVFGNTVTDCYENIRQRFKEYIPWNNKEHFFKYSTRGLR